MPLIKKIIVALLIILSVIGVYSMYRYWSDVGAKKDVSATVMLERVEKVMKLVTIEGNFSEIYNYKHHILADLWPFRKKALVRINAKVSIGYDFEKATIDIDETKRVITISDMPEPEILTIEHDMDYYNFDNGLFNMITNKDITDMGFEAKEFIIEKAKQSDLFDQAEEQRRDLFEILALAIEASGWRLIMENEITTLKN